MISLKSLLLEPKPITLAVAESMTCGRIQAQIGLISGASGFFLGGITAYSLEQKVRHLSVDRAIAEPVNSISIDVAEQMAIGACRLFGSELAISTTGYAEPSPENKVDHPMAWWAIAHDLGAGNFRVHSAMVEIPGATRSKAQETVTAVALNGLVRYLKLIREGGDKA